MLVATAAFLGILIYFMIGSHHRHARKPLSYLPQHEMPTQNGAAGVSSKLSDTQSISLDHVSAISDTEMLGLVANMSPAQRFLLAKRLAEKRGNFQKIASFFKAWSAIDGLAAIKASLEFLYPTQRETALQGVFEGADARTAKDLVSQLAMMEPGAINAEFAQELLSIGLGKWSSIDPQTAAVFLQTHGSGFSGSVYQTVAANFARQSVPDALAWKETQPEAARSSIMQGILSTWLAEKPSDAIAYAKTHKDGELGYVANSIAATDPAAAKALVDGLPAQDQPGIAYSTAIRMAHDDPAGAAAWVGTLPAASQEAAAGAVAMQYATQDPEAGLAWINTLSGITKDTALSTYAPRLSDRGLGMTNAFSITDDSLRTNTVNSIAQQWNAVDPVAFRSWLKQSGLPLETQEALLPKP